jgi:uracil-DNA glycosylase
MAERRTSRGAASTTDNAPVETTWSAQPFVPEAASVGELASAAHGCRGCPLYADAHHAVFGEGRPGAPLVLVGEQPGDQEDVQGRPFVGPAGRVLWGCLAAAGIDRDDVYVTNAVKHFKHETRGTRRLHKKPDVREVEACHPWLEAELAAVDGRVIVALGATAARSLLGRTVPIESSRRSTFEVHDRPTVVTYHPSAILRARDDAAELRVALTSDLRRAGTLARRG